MENEVAGTIGEGSEFWHYALRSDDYKYEVGAVIDFCSRYHEDGVATDDIHNGLSAIVIDINDGDGVARALRYHGLGRLKSITWPGYGGRYLYLLGSDDAEGGNDAGEIIMIEPKVLAVIDTKA